MDEPLVQTNACHYTDADVLTQTVAYVNLLKQKSPSLAIGDIEPWPSCRYARLTNWITAFSQQAGFNLAFFHLDVDLEAARDINSDLSVLSEIPQLATFCKLRGIPFGVIIWQANVQLPVDSNQAFCDNALYGAQIVHSICDVDQAVVQSWEQYPDQNVPDSQPFTFTHLLIDYTTKIVSVPFPNPDVVMHYPGQVAIHGRTGASYNVQTTQDLSVSNIWHNAATILMENSDTIWKDPTPTIVTKFYRVIGSR